MFRMAQFYKPANVLELGTSLGITTAYLAAANNQSLVTTMEGAGEVAAIARKNFERLNLQNIQIVTGNFDETLSPVLQKMPSIDFAFIDGNHRKAPTLLYFQQLLNHILPSSILIFDDIHWSKEMEDAWKIIQQHKQVKT